jgi:CBS domain containing-hemolysin-like protein
MLEIKRDRYPVAAGDKDRILGIVHMKDMFMRYAEKGEIA